MKVLFVLDRYDPDIGGSEKLFKLLIQGLENKQVECTILCCKHPKRAKQPNIIEFPFRSRILFALLGNLWVLRHSRKVDLIHSSSFFSGLACTLSVIFGKQSVLTYHEVWLKKWNLLPYLSPFQKWQLRNMESFLTKIPFTKIVAVSEFTHLALKNVYPAKRIARVQNAVVPTEEVSTAQKNDHYLMYGRLGVSKGWHLLKDLQKFELPEKFKLRLVLPKYPEWLWKKIGPELNAPFMEVVGELSDADLQHEIRSAKAVIVPSFSEGFGFVAAEVSGLGTPLIHSGRGALPEVVFGKCIEMEEYSSKGLAEAIWKAEKNEFQEVHNSHSSGEQMAYEYLEIYRDLVPQKL